MDITSILLPAFAAAVSIWTIIARAKEASAFSDRLAALQQHAHLETYDFSRTIKIGYVLCIISGAGYMIWGILEKDSVNTAVGLIIAGVFTGELLLTNKKYRLCYNDEGFVGNDGTLVEYRSIRDIQEIRHLSFAWKRIFTFNGKEYRVSPKSVTIIEEKLRERSMRKKNRSAR